MKSEHDVISQETECSEKENEVSIFINFRFGSHGEARVKCVREKACIFQFCTQFQT